MRKSEITIGNSYVAKISQKLTVVRIDSNCSYGGWLATNNATGREVHIPTAGKLRRPAKV